MPKLIPVKGDEVRHTIDPDFSGICCHHDIPQIPEDEFWIEDFIDPKEYPYQLAYMNSRCAALDHGLPMELAEDIGEANEKMARAVFEDAPDTLILFTFQVRNIVVDIVNGDTVRRDHPAFTQADNWCHSPWIEDHHIWIEDLTPMTLVHEWFECWLIQLFHLPYLQAHNMALVVQEWFY